MGPASPSRGHTSRLAAGPYPAPDGLGPEQVLLEAVIPCSGADESLPHAPAPPTIRASPVRQRGSMERAIVDIPTHQPISTASAARSTRPRARRFPLQIPPQQRQPATEVSRARSDFSFHNASPSSFCTPHRFQAPPLRSRCRGQLRPLSTLQQALDPRLCSLRRQFRSLHQALPSSPRLPQ
jgi:hypothetical protein